MAEPHDACRLCSYLILIITDSQVGSVHQTREGFVASQVKALRRATLALTCIHVTALATATITKLEGLGTFSLFFHT